MLTNIEMKIIVGLHRNVNFIDKNTAKIVKKYNLTFSQFMVLEALYNKGNMTISQVREKILSSVGTIPIIVNNLVKLNYIKRLSDEKDRRICILELTEKGYEIISQAVLENENMIIESMKNLNVDEKNSLLYLLKKLNEEV